MAGVQVFTAQSADGQSTVITTQDTGELIVAVSGDLGGGTLEVQVSPDGGTTWIAETTMTADSTYRFKPFDGSDAQVRLDLSGATGPNVNAWIGPTNV